MNKKAMYKLSYGLFVLTAKDARERQWVHYQYGSSGSVGTKSIKHMR